MNLNQAQKKKEREQIVQNVMKRVEVPVMARTKVIVLAASTLVLHDKFGFGKQRLTKYVAEVADLFDSMEKKFVSFEDIRTTVYNELGIDFEEAERLINEKYGREPRRSSEAKPEGKRVSAKGDSESKAENKI